MFGSFGVAVFRKKKISWNVRKSYFACLENYELLKMFGTFELLSFHFVMSNRKFLVVHRLRI